MNGKYPTEMLKHLEKESEVLMEAFRSMSHELHKLQVEEEMLMHKLFEQMQGQGAPEKRENGLKQDGNSSSTELVPILAPASHNGNHAGSSGNLNQPPEKVIREGKVKM